MIKTPLLAIDVPPKALVWEDDQGKVWLSYNSSDYANGEHDYPAFFAACERALKEERNLEDRKWSADSQNGAVDPSRFLALERDVFSLIRFGIPKSGLF